ncbi:MAG: hypothetical protein FH751_15240 [Firmicutes bacterium]|nr:hypothetical protein [Bacillota bacterium]
MKKIFLFLMIFILLIIPVGCESNKHTISKEIDSDKKILGLVKHIEKTDGKYYNLEISYKDYSRQLKEIEVHLSSFVDHSTDGLKEFHFSKCPIIQVRHSSPQQYLESKNMEKLPWEINKSEISNVYTEKQNKYKYVLTKMYWGYTDENYWIDDYKGSWRGNMWTLRKYTFIEKEGQWKLLSVVREDKLMDGDKEKEPMLDKFNNEKVKFNEIIEY